MRSLYLHFPFCETKCHYCDFYSLGRERTRPGDATKFERALALEISRQAPLLAPELDTIFMGGGTPSMTEPDAMARAIEPLWKFTRVTPATEWTMEANPSSITLEKMKKYRALGVNRVSMGVQAMRDDLLKDLGRVHSRDEALRSLSALFEAGFESVSVDLLCGIPGQSLIDLEKALEELNAFPIVHLSCYLLTLAKHHPMHSRLPNEDTQLEHLLLIDRWMAERGFEHYEISNFAKPGKRARHNMNYWRGESYLGLGPSAHSFDSKAQRRWKNLSSLHKYCCELDAGRSVMEWEETLDSSQQELEKWMLGLRLSDGFPACWLDTPARVKQGEVLRASALLEPHPGHPDRLRLTGRGFALSDPIIQSLA